jgi:HEAT repeat protein
VYLLSFELQWRDSKKIAFKPVTILVQSTSVSKPSIAPELQKTLLALASSDEKVKAKAKEELKNLGEKAAPYLVNLLNHENLKLRDEATFTLIAMQGVAVPSLLAGTAYLDRETRIRAIFALGQIGDQQAWPTLWRLLFSDPEKEIRSTILRFIAEHIEDAEAIPLMVKALRDTSPEIRAEALQALTKRTQVDLGFLPHGTPEERKKGIERWEQWWQQRSPDAFK